jgi:hypothetical protein
VSTQRYHFLTIVGRAARDVETACEAVLARRVDDHLHGVGGTDYGPADHARLERICLSLLDAADELPVLHHATCLDGWAMGNRALTLLPWPDGRSRAALGLNYGLAIYPSRQAPALLAATARAHRRAARRGDVALYESNIALAIAAARMFKVNYLVAVVANCLGPSRLDADVQISAKAPLPGVSRGHPRRPRDVIPSRASANRATSPVARTSSSDRARS